MPWLVTGNHWLSIPCIHPADGAVHAVGVLHRGARSAVEFAGAADFLTASGPALLRPVIRVDGATRRLSDEGVAWEKAFGWLPTFTCTMGSLLVRGTIFAPYGRDSDMAGAVYMIAVENRGSAAVEVDLGLEGTLGHRQTRVRTARPFDDGHRVSATADRVVLLEGTALPGIVALALTSDGEPTLEVGTQGEGSFAVRRTVRVSPGTRAETAFYLAAGPERDGAQATAAVMRRRGWRDLLSATRDALQSLEQVTGNEQMDRLLSRNLLFAYFYAVGRALDDAHFYLVRSRAPWNGKGLTIRDWEALTWTIPAVQLADPPLARELLLRMCELHGYAPGRGVNYLDGTQFEPGFSLEGAAAYAIAVDRYIRDTDDDQLVDELPVADALYLSFDDIAARRDKEHALYATDVTPGGTPAAFPYTLHGNAAVALALDVLRRTLDEETAGEVEDPEAVRSAIRHHFTVETSHKAVYASAANLRGERVLDDDPSASALWLPAWDFVGRDDSAYRRTVKAAAAEPDLLAARLARLIGPQAQAGQTLQWLRRASLDGGLAAEFVDGDGRATGNGGDAALSGLLAYGVWYAVHALGARA